MKTTVLFLLLFFSFHVSAQDLHYLDKEIRNNDTVLFRVLEYVDQRELQFEDYLISDSSQYYDYYVVDTNDQIVLGLISLRQKGLGRHIIELPFQTKVLFNVIITQNDHVSVLAENETYRFYLFDYLIYKGLITKDGMNYDKDFLIDFREFHRE